jgi:hypothetical protein
MCNIVKKKIRKYSTKDSSIVIYKKDLILAVYTCRTGVSTSMKPNDSIVFRISETTCPKCKYLS